MYGIFTYIYHKHQPNVGKYTIHGSYGLPCFVFEAVFVRSTLMIIIDDDFSPWSAKGGVASNGKEIFGGAKYAGERFDASNKSPRKPNPYHPWDWYIYLHENHKNQPNVSKYTSPMDAMGNKDRKLPFLPQSWKWKTTWMSQEVRIHG